MSRLIEREEWKGNMGQTECVGKWGWADRELAMEQENAHQSTLSENNIPSVLRFRVYNNPSLQCFRSLFFLK